jgi:cell wall-associated NlpC family hydrolase
LVKVPGWQDLPVTVAAQRVQRSAAPSAYAKHEALAATVAAALTAGTCLASGTGSPAAQRALAYALAQLGLPYLWGGDGPANGENGFDCSGLTTAAYAAAGIRLPRIAQAQYDVGPRLAPGAPLRPGDLLFFGTPTNVHHVGIYLNHHQMINAAHAGTPVRVEDYTTWPDLLAASRPIS